MSNKSENYLVIGSKRYDLTLGKKPNVSSFVKHEGNFFSLTEPIKDTPTLAAKSVSITKEDIQGILLKAIQQVRGDFKKDTIKWKDIQNKHIGDDSQNSILNKHMYLIMIQKEFNYLILESFSEIKLKKQLWRENKISPVSRQT